MPNCAACGNPILPNEMDLELGTDLLPSAAVTLHADCYAKMRNANPPERVTVDPDILGRRVGEKPPEPLIQRPSAL